MKRVRCIISGDVVGVGFRTWVRGKAKELGLIGWVNNREDKTVELVVEGEKIPLEKLIALCRKGPDVSWVEHVDTTWESARGEFVGFEVVY
jgi:acylphosphatase